MKGKRNCKADGGPAAGDKEWEKDTTPSETYAGKGSNVEKEAEERKRGGRAKRKSGGKLFGAAAKNHAGRTPRRSGGRTGSNANPLSSAHSGTPPSGHKVMSGEPD